MLSIAILLMTGTSLPRSDSPLPDLVELIEEAAVRKGEEVSVSVFPETEAREAGLVADLILLDPRISHLKAKVTSISERATVAAMDPVDFNSTDGDTLLTRITDAFQQRERPEAVDRSDHGCTRPTELFPQHDNKSDCCLQYDEGAGALERLRLESMPVKQPI